MASKSRHGNTQHSEQHYVCHRELAVCSVLVMSIYVKLLCTMKFLTSDMHGACDCVSQTPRVHSIMHLSMVCPTYNTWGLMGDRRGIDISPIPGQGTNLCTIPLHILHKYLISPCHVQCVRGRYRYLRNSQRIFETYLERKCVYHLSGLGQFQLSTNPMGKTLMATPSPPLFSNMHPRYAKWGIPLIGTLATQNSLQGGRSFE